MTTERIVLIALFSCISVACIFEAISCFLKSFCNKVILNAVMAIFAVILAYLLVVAGKNPYSWQMIPFLVCVFFHVIWNQVRGRFK